MPKRYSVSLRALQPIYTRFCPHTLSTIAGRIFMPISPFRSSPCHVAIFGGILLFSKNYPCESFSYRFRFAFALSLERGIYLQSDLPIYANHGSFQTIPDRREKTGYRSFDRAGFVFYHPPILFLLFFRSMIPHLILEILEV